MKNFAICLVLFNLLYLSWNMGFLQGPDNDDIVVIREPFQQALQSLVMLNELSDFQPVETRLPEVIIAEPAEEVSIVPTNAVKSIELNLGCLAVGEFENVAVSNVLVTELRNKGFQVRVHLQEKIESEYRVYMPPFNSDVAARQVLASLSEDGIDSFLIVDGDFSNGISLGVFSVQTSAFILQEELATEGYATNIQETVHSNTEFWIVINSTGTELKALQLTLLDSWPALKQSENLCQIIAPEA